MYTLSHTCLGGQRREPSGNDSNGRRNPLLFLYHRRAPADLETQQACAPRITSSTEFGITRQSDTKARVRQARAAQSDRAWGSRRHVSARPGRSSARRHGHVLHEPLTASTVRLAADGGLLRARCDGGSWHARASAAASSADADSAAGSEYLSGEKAMPCASGHFTR